MVYVSTRHPPEYVVSGSEILVCQLKKALYGLKQSPRAWFDKFILFLLNMAFDTACQIMQCLSVVYIGVIVLIIYVDDIVIYESDSVGIVDLKAYLSRQFHTKYLGTLRYFLGIEVA